MSGKGASSFSDTANPSRVHFYSSLRLLILVEIPPCLLASFPSLFFLSFPPVISR